MSDVSGLARSSARLWQPVRMAPPPSSPSSIWWQGSVKKFTKKGGILVAYNRVKTEFIQEHDGDWSAYFPSVLPWNPCQVLKDYHRPSWQCTFLCAPCLFKSHHSFDLLRQIFVSRLAGLSSHPVVHLNLGLLFQKLNRWQILQN